VKNYLYTLFPNTAQKTVLHYKLKYGGDATVKEALDDPIFRQWYPSQPGHYHDYSKAAITRPELKPGLERHDDLVINGYNSPGHRLEKVMPWDMLMVIGHGLATLREEDGKNFLVSNPEVCRSDDGAETRTVSDVVSWFKSNMDNLSKDHVLIKLLMCCAGGEYKQQIPSDCFARRLAIALRKGGWRNAIVGGYKGEVAITSPGLKRPWVEDKPGGIREVKEAEITPLAKKVDNSAEHQYLGSKYSTAPAKENIVYFHGSEGKTVNETRVKRVKAILRLHPGEDDIGAAVAYLKQVFATLKTKGWVGGLEEQVAEALLQRLARQVTQQLTPERARTLCKEVRGSSYADDPLYAEVEKAAPSTRKAAAEGTGIFKF
jgi:hypothetical protein